MSSIACVGECMLELTSLTNGNYKMGFGGDTLNTAVYMARLGVRTSFISAIGRDDLSQKMLKAWQQEGIDVSHVVQDEEHNCGLYAVQTDNAGERSFTYWRSDSAAKHLFQHSQSYFSDLVNYKMAYFSGITLSLLSDTTFEALISELKSLKNTGLQVVFDLNYRPKNWRSAAVAKERISAFMHVVDVALPSFDDEQLLFEDASVYVCIERYAKAGVHEVVLKNGEDGCYVFSLNGNHKSNHKSNHRNTKNTVHYAVTELVHPKDTTAAGDSFNAGYLAKRLLGESIPDAVRSAQRCAGLVIQHSGAIVDSTIFKDANI